MGIVALSPLLSKGIPGTTRQYYVMFPEISRMSYSDLFVIGTPGCLINGQICALRPYRQVVSTRIAKTLSLGNSALKLADSLAVTHVLTRSALI
jgi:hypothetical protein